MPFKSKAQARFMFARHPKLAKEFAAHTRNIKSLPEKKTMAKNMPSFKAKKEADVSFPRWSENRMTDKSLKTKQMKGKKSKKK